MMKSSPYWTKRAATRLRNAVKYIAVIISVKHILQKADTLSDL